MTPKEFQSATIKHVLSRLNNHRSSRRFLVADEVGLGKTIVAQGVIEGLQSRNKQKQVFYICSSLAIANQNCERLVEFLPKEIREKCVVPVDRLTLLPQHKPDPELPLALYSLTPGTTPSDKVRGRGRMDERAMIAAVLMRAFGLRSNNWIIDDLCRNNITKVNRWEDKVEEARKYLNKTDPYMRDRLVKHFRDQVKRQFGFAWNAPYDSVLKRIRNLSDDEGRSTKISKLRKALGFAAVQNIDTDLIILDEFQRFFDRVVLEERLSLDNVDVESTVDGNVASLESRKVMAAAEHIDDLMAYIIKRRHNNLSSGILMLSATPYKLLSKWNESASDHHSEFFRLLRFLAGPEEQSKVEDIEKLFSRYGDLLRSFKGVDNGINDLKDELSTMLSNYVARTERIDVFHDSDRNIPIETRISDIEINDIRTFRHAVDSADRKHRWMSEALWSSVPFPMQMMDDGYEFRKNARPKRGIAAGYEWKLDDVRHYRAIEPTNPRLRRIANDIPKQLFKLPWLPPNKPWWQLEGLFEGIDTDSVSKLLCFSRFRAAPKAIASWLSYECERASYLGSKKKYDYLRRRRLLVDGVEEIKGLNALPAPSFDFSGESRYQTLAYFLPLPFLAGLGDPMECLGDIGALSYEQALNAVANKIGKLFDENAPILRKQISAGIWALIVESKSEDFEENWDHYEASPDRKEKKDVFRALWDCWDEVEKYRDYRPSEEAILRLSEIAMTAPGQVLYRCAKRIWKKSNSKDLISSVTKCSVSSVRTYLDQPEFHGSFDRIGLNHPRNTLRVIWDGNFESVIDEFLVLKGGAARSAEKVLDELQNALTIRTASVAVKHTDRIGPEFDLRLRCHYALPLSIEQGEEVDSSKKLLRTDSIRHAFNSPFWPFVLVTTSIGQEGLDFHQYCDKIIHWDLPHNPVDLEQRDGRIQRFLGYSVRKRLPKDVKLNPATSAWTEILDAAKNLEGQRGMIPWWYVEGATIQRVIYCPEFSESVQYLEKLKKAVAIYRMVLGQANQENLMNDLQTRMDTMTDEERALFLEWLWQVRIELSPVGRKIRKAS